MRLDFVNLTNFNCFEQFTLALAPRFNLIVGDNATGKTTLLDATAIGVSALLEAITKGQSLGGGGGMGGGGGGFFGQARNGVTNTIRSEHARAVFYRHGDTLTAEATYPVTIECQGEVSAQAGVWTRSLSGSSAPPNPADTAWIESRAAELKSSVSKGGNGVLPVFSVYGSSRRWASSEGDIKTLKPGSRLAAYGDCLTPALNVENLLQWFKSQELIAVQERRRLATLEACRETIRSCLPEAERVYFSFAHDELMLRFPDREFPFRHLSDGYRMALAMTADIAVRCATLNPQLLDKAAKETPGVVLIDEIDLHLHPKWQRRIVGDLMQAFPLVQFIATTHSPFVIQSLPAQEDVRLINLDFPGAEDYSNKSIEDVAEEIQGVDTPQRSQRFLDMMAAAEKYYAALRESPDDPSNEQLSQLRRRLDELSLPFSDDPAYQAFLKSQRLASGVDGKAG